MKRLTLPTFALVVGWFAVMTGAGILYGWGKALIGGGIAAIGFAFVSWLWTT